MGHFFFLSLLAAHGSDEYIKMIIYLTLCCPEREGYKRKILIIYRCYRTHWRAWYRDTCFSDFSSVFLLGSGLLLKKQMNVMDFNFTNAQGKPMKSKSAFSALTHSRCEEEDFVPRPETSRLSGVALSGDLSLERLEVPWRNDSTFLPSVRRAFLGCWSTPGLL